MRPGWNPGRRNRNVGTKAHGHGNDNKMKIPQSWRRRYYFERLESAVTVKRMLAGREILFFVEPPRPDWFYPCTVDDICTVLEHCPPEDLRLIDFIVLRQHTRKQRLLSPVWGRAQYYYDLASHSGSAIMIEAQSLETIRWSEASIHPESQRELERLRADGHTICQTRRGIDIIPSPASLRHTLLYRTVLHELGHHVDYFDRCPPGEWWSRTSSSKEDFAHRYAAECYRTLELQGIVPFAPKLEQDVLVKDGLDPAWFTAP